MTSLVPVAPGLRRKIQLQYYTQVACRFAVEFRNFPKILV